VRPGGSLLNLNPYFFFFPGITLATALATDPATFAMTPFFDPRFLLFGFVVLAFDLPDRAFGAVFDFVFFFLAVFAITHSATPSPVP
jgi:hypothetical protein